MEKFYNRNLTYSEVEKLHKKINKILTRYDLELYDLFHFNYLCEHLLEELSNNNLSESSLHILNSLSNLNHILSLDNFR